MTRASLYDATMTVTLGVRVRCCERKPRASRGDQPNRLNHSKEPHGPVHQEHCGPESEQGHDDVRNGWHERVLPMGREVEPLPSLAGGGCGIGPPRGPVGGASRCARERRVRRAPTESVAFFERDSE